MRQRLKKIGREKIALLLLAVFLLMATAWVYHVASSYVRQREVQRQLKWEVPLSQGMTFSQMQLHRQSAKLAEYGLHFYGKEDKSVYDGKVWGIKDGAGKVVIPAAYEEIWIDTQLDYLLCGGTTPDGMYSYRYYRMDGSDMIKGAWSSASVFCKGYACVEDGRGNYRIIGEDGTAVGEFTCEWMSDFNPEKGWYCFEPYRDDDQPAGQWGIMDRQGRVLLEPSYDMIERPSDGRVLVSGWDSEEYRQKYMYLDGDTLQAVTGQGYENAYSYSDGMAAVNLGGIKWQVLDRDGGVMAEMNCQELYPYEDGIAVMRKKDKLFAVDTAGKQLFEIPRHHSLWNPGQEYIYTAMSRYSEGLIVFQGKGGRYGYMDRRGNVAVEPVFDYAQSFEQGGAFVEMNSKYGMITNPLKY